MISTVAGWLAALLVVLTALGALVTLVVGPLLGEFAVASVVVLILVVAAVAAGAVRGARAGGWLSTPYW
ncbi:hypothetical protein ACFQE8_18225 [Salinirubellus sp. GCM10025818]|jgi:hypothetical protein|uniref:hypothetical protein n=1 Tax=Salinirubellus TaxID=2162630 RepID=UPI0030D60625